MVTISTTVVDDVREHHFRCIAGHQYSILAKDDLDIVPMLSVCAVTGCYKWAQSVGENPAQVSKNATDLLTH